jgi:hypothetical protein
MTAPVNELKYPKVLTNKDWQNKKGVIAKIVGKTGIGEALNAANKAYNKIDWNLYDVSQVIPSQQTITYLTQFKKAAMANYKTAVEPTRAELQKVVNLATKQAAEWKKNRLIPAGSVKQLQEIIDAANVLRGDLAGNSAAMSGLMRLIDKKLAEKERAAEEGKKNLAKSITLLEDGLKKVAANPTKDEWEMGGTWQAVRGVSNAVRAIDALKAIYWKDWQPYGDRVNKYIPTGDGETEAVKTAAAAVSKNLATLKANYQSDLA